ncbi:MAG: hypothetical protein ACOVQ2_03110 [Flavobacterium sp.]
MDSNDLDDELLVEEQIYHIHFASIFELTDLKEVSLHTTYRGKIYRSNGSIKPHELEFIGTILLDIVHLQQIKDLDFDMDFFLSCNVVNDLKLIFDRDKPKLTDAFLALQTKSIENSDILLIDKFFILPEFRGLNIGLKIIELLKFKFKHSCGLIVGLVEPFQFSVHYNENFVEKNKEMTFDKFTKDKELAHYQLMNYFSKIQFLSANEINSKIIYLNTNDIDVNKLNFHI